MLALTKSEQKKLDGAHAQLERLFDYARSRRERSLPVDAGHIEAMLTEPVYVLRYLASLKSKDEAKR